MRYPDPAQADSFVSGSRVSGVSQIRAGSQGICGVYILLTPQNPMIGIDLIRGVGLIKGD